MVCLGVRSGQDPADSRPWSREAFLASLAFQGVEEGKGGAYLGGRVRGGLPDHPWSLPHPPTAPPSLGRKRMELAFRLLGRSF